MKTELIVTIVIAVMGSSALFTFVQFLIQRRDNKDVRTHKILGKMQDLCNIVTELSAKIDRHQATQSRIRILRAGDEMRLNIKHSHEYFKQLNEDISLYQS